MKKRLNRTSKIVYTFFVGIAIVAFWRGAWGLMDLYLFPNNYFLSYSIALMIGIIILILTRNFVKRLV